MTNKTEHPQAYLLRWIADGEAIERSYITEDNWVYLSTFAVLQDMMNDISCKKYRIKPKTIRIGKYDVAEPMKEKPAYGTVYWTLNQIGESSSYCYEWRNEDIDKQFITNGMCWLNEEDAELAAKAIKELLTGTEC